MVKPEPKIELGKDLINILDEKGINPTAFLWFYLPDGNTWRLVMSSPSLDKDIKKAYEDFIKEFGKEVSVKAIGLSNISIVPGDNNLLRLLKTAIKTGRGSIGGVRFTSNIVNGVLIEDAYIYRLV